MLFFQINHLLQMWQNILSGSVIHFCNYLFEDVLLIWIQFAIGVNNGAFANLFKGFWTRIALDLINLFLTVALDFNLIVQSSGRFQHSFLLINFRMFIYSDTNWTQNLYKNSWEKTGTKICFCRGEVQRMLIERQRICAFSKFCETDFKFILCFIETSDYDQCSLESINWPG